MEVYFYEKTQVRAAADNEIKKSLSRYMICKLNWKTTEDVRRMH